MYIGALPAASNRADWRMAFQLLDANTDEVVDIQSCDITMTVRNLSKGSLLTGSTDSGEITIGTDNIFQWLFPAQRMNVLCQGEYDVGLRVAEQDRVSQVFIATLNVFEGIDQQ